MACFVDLSERRRKEKNGECISGKDVEMDQACSNRSNEMVSFHDLGRRPFKIKKNLEMKGGKR